MSSSPKRVRVVHAWVRPIVGTIALIACVLSTSTIHAQSEDEIKAAFLLNFARYVEWPDSAFSAPESPVQICLLDSVRFSSVVEGTVEGKAVGPRSVEVKNVDAPRDARRCHILFVDVETSSESTVVDALRDSSVFTVANDEGFAKNGGIANFYRSGNRIRFQINPGAAQSAGLKISSRLLRLAQLVE